MSETNSSKWNNINKGSSIYIIFNKNKNSHERLIITQHKLHFYSLQTNKRTANYPIHPKSQISIKDNLIYIKCTEPKINYKIYLETVNAESATMLVEYLTQMIKLQEKNLTSMNFSAQQGCYFVFTSHFPKQKLYFWLNDQSTELRFAKAKNSNKYQTCTYIYIYINIVKLSLIEEVKMICDDNSVSPSECPEYKLNISLPGEKLALSSPDFNKIKIWMLVLQYQGIKQNPEGYKSWRYLTSVDLLLEKTRIILEGLILNGTGRLKHLFKKHLELYTEVVDGTHERNKAEEEVLRVITTSCINTDLMDTKRITIGKCVSKKKSLNLPTSHKHGHKPSIYGVDENSVPTISTHNGGSHSSTQKSPPVEAVQRLHDNFKKQWGKSSPENSSNIGKRVESTNTTNTTKGQNTNSHSQYNFLFASPRELGSGRGTSNSSMGKESNRYNSDKVEDVGEIGSRQHLTFNTRERGQGVVKSLGVYCPGRKGVQHPVQGVETEAELEEKKTQRAEYGDKCNGDTELYSEQNNEQNNNMTTRGVGYNSMSILHPNNKTKRKKSSFDLVNFESHDFTNEPTNHKCRGGMQLGTYQPGRSCIEEEIVSCETEIERFVAEDEHFSENDSLEQLNTSDLRDHSQGEVSHIRVSLGDMDFNQRIKHDLGVCRNISSKEVDTDGGSSSERKRDIELVESIKSKKCSDTENPTENNTENNSMSADHSFSVDYAKHHLHNHHNTSSGEPFETARFEYKYPPSNRLSPTYPVVNNIYIEEEDYSTQSMESMEYRGAMSSSTTNSKLSLVDEVEYLKNKVAMQSIKFRDQIHSITGSASTHDDGYCNYLKTQVDAFKGKLKGRKKKYKRLNTLYLNLQNKLNKSAASITQINGEKEENENLYLGRIQKLENELEQQTSKLDRTEILNKSLFEENKQIIQKNNELTQKLKYMMELWGEEKEGYIHNNHRGIPPPGISGSGEYRNVNHLISKMRIMQTDSSTFRAQNAYKPIQNMNLNLVPSPVNQNLSNNSIMFHNYASHPQNRSRSPSPLGRGANQGRPAQERKSNFSVGAFFNGVMKIINI